MDQGSEHAPNDNRTDYLAVEQTPRFTELKRRHRAFVLPVAALFLIWLLLKSTFISNVLQD